MRHQRPPHPFRRFLPGLLVVTLAFALGTACSDEDKDEARETATSLGNEVDDRAGQAGARAQAEALRGLIKDDDRTPANGPQSIAVLQESAAELPGDPEVGGIADADGDGLDDDGKVEVAVNDESACLTIGTTADEIEVAGGSCNG